MANWDLDKTQEFCLENAGKMARGLNTTVIIGRITSFRQNAIFLAPDNSRLYLDRTNEIIILPYLFESEWFVVSKANLGIPVFPDSVIVLEMSKKELKNLIKALEL